MSETLGEYNLCTGIAISTIVFGFLALLILKKLKELTHGAEDNEGSNHEEAEGFELADKEA